VQRTTDSSPKAAKARRWSELLRRFWLPVLCPRNCLNKRRPTPPKKIVVMGEELLVVRDSRGVVGVIDHIARTAAPSVVGRVEECGIRLRLSRLEIRHRRQLPDMPTS